MDTTTEEDLFPKKNKKRAKRRFHRLRMIAKAKRIAKNIWNYSTTKANKEACKYADNLAYCDCWMCNNQRKRFGPKFSEIRKTDKVTKEDASAEYKEIKQEEQDLTYRWYGSFE